MAKQMIKIKVKDFDGTGLEKIKARNILKAKAMYEGMPFCTKVYLVMKSKLPYSFISNNWKEITGHEFE